MIILTGAAGFIGSVVLKKLNDLGNSDILIVDNLGDTDKWKNLVGKQFADYLHKSKLAEYLNKIKPADIEAIIHLGACSSTTERDAEYLMDNNFRYTRFLAELAIEHDIRFIYASSGATYGNGTQGFSDSNSVTPSLVPENMYGYSKHLSDLWTINNGYTSKITGLKFFNVYGPNEYHKGNMSSVVFKAFHQVKKEGRITLFKSHRPEYADGEQRRDFIYVKDVAETIIWFLQNREVNGIYNLGFGKSRSWNDLAKAVFKAMNCKPVIEYVEMPESIRDRYQYFTEAEMNKLKDAGYTTAFTSLEAGVEDYIRNYLSKEHPYL
ncbi:MAG: ADP-glyceromanno-heptose 6-epimerase [Candidatus Cloacimonetes bacterium]|nr:ADP-glyceromanno-heptose 6-epimerase [Candidatus Cloacimonadota bacterium]